jgi:hypothetical protein
MRREREKRLTLITKFSFFLADGITIVFEFSKPNPQRFEYTAITAVITNSNPTPVLNFQLQAAVPKVVI